jgi:hypothetical protein
VKRLQTLMSALAVVALLAAAPPAEVQAQDTDANLMLYWSKGFRENTNLLNSSFALYYLRTMGSFQIDFHLPFARWDPDVDGVDPENAFGNPRIGINLFREGSPLMYRAGVRLPLAPDDAPHALFEGLLTDPVLMGTWYAGAVAVDAAVGYFKQNMEGLGYWFSLGLEAVYDTDAPDGADTTEFYVPLMLSVSYPVAGGSLLAGLSGSYWVTEDDGYGGDNPAYLLGGLGYRFMVGSLNPEIWFGIPVSSAYGDAVDFLLSIGIGFGIP